MTFERPFRIATYTLVGTGLVSVTLPLGSAVWLFGGLFVFGCCVVLRTVRPTWRMRRGFVTAGVLLVTLAVLAEVVSTGTVLVPAAHFLVLVQLIWLTEERSNRNYGWLGLLSLLQMALGAVLSVDLAYGACFAIFLPAGVAALLLFNLRCELERHGALTESRLRDQRLGSRLLASVGLVAAAELALTILIFIYFPRFGLQIFQLRPVQRGTSLTGFSDTVSLGDLSRILDNSQVVMAVKLRRGGEAIRADGFPLRLRGMALSTYGHATWKTPRYESDSTIYPLPFPESMYAPEPRPEDIVQEIILEPINSRCLFHIARALEFRSNSSNLDEVTYHRPTTTYMSAQGAGVSLQYTVRSRIPSYPLESLQAPMDIPDEPSAWALPYLHLPGTIGPRVRALAERIVRGIPRARFYDRAKAVEAYLSTHYGYTLSPGPAARDVDPIEDFLFDKRQGHCEYFAGAMVVLLRTIGIPCRMITGFSGGDWNAYGRFYLVRQRHAHAWVEVKLPSIPDWVPFDPTPAYVTRRPPPSQGWLAGLSERLTALRMWWNSYVVNYSSQDQKNLAEAITAFLARLPSSLPHWGRGMFSLESGTTRGSLALLVLGSSLVVVVGLGLAAWWLVGRRGGRGRRRGVPGRPAVHFYRKMDDILRRRGFRRELATTPAEFARHVVAVGGEVYQPVETITEAFCRVRYGGHRLTFGERAAVHHALADLERKKPRARQ